MDPPTVISALPCRTRMCKSRSPSGDSMAMCAACGKYGHAKSVVARRLGGQRCSLGRKVNGGAKVGGYRAGRRGRKWQRDLRQGLRQSRGHLRLSPKTALARLVCCLGGH